MAIRNLEPNLLWTYFYEITQIPRPSKREGRIIEYLLNFAEKLNLEIKTDHIGNILIKKAATHGYENLPTVILQAHVDMVCEKNSDTIFDFDNDPIQTYIDGDWLKAKGTTLGADNGIGVAAALAILASEGIEHGNLECLFTVDEETGLTGAYALEENFLAGHILINLDTEEEGELNIGCAGGKGTGATFKYEESPTPPNYYWFNLHVEGLSGGHSGTDIHKGLGNANKILARFLWTLSNKMEIFLSSIKGGNLHNAIAREAHALAGIPIEHKEQVKSLLNTFASEIKDELGAIDPHLKVWIESTDTPHAIIEENVGYRLIYALCACPHGVLAMSNSIPGLVETSTNLASIKMKEDNTIVIGTSQRSSTDSLKVYATNMVNAVFTLAGATVEHSDGYPGWKPNPTSEILEVARNTYNRMYNQEPHIRAIHAGLECGLILEKYPHLDMVSCGPTITDAHSPAEQVNIPSVTKWWDLLLEILKSIAPRTVVIPEVEVVVAPAAEKEQEQEVPAPMVEIHEEALVIPVPTVEIPEKVTPVPTMDIPEPTPTMQIGERRRINKSYI
ncbi:MAG: hypothetical protein RL662_2510 [Bacteroidota bacterium]|jgi:dipeptidase D